jgi:hypothetical protein
MLTVKYERPVFDESGRYVIRLGVSQWDKTDKSAAFCWQDVNGKFSRGTVKEFPATTLALFNGLAYETGFIPARELLREIPTAALLREALRRHEEGAPADA